MCGEIILVVMPYASLHKTCQEGIKMKNIDQGIYKRDIYALPDIDYSKKIMVSFHFTPVIHKPNKPINYTAKLNEPCIGRLHEKKGEN